MSASIMINSLQSIVHILWQVHLYGASYLRMRPSQHRVSKYFCRLTIVFSANREVMIEMEEDCEYLGERKKQMGRSRSVILQ